MLTEVFGEFKGRTRRKSTKYAPVALPKAGQYTAFEIPQKKQGTPHSIDVSVGSSEFAEKSSSAPEELKQEIFEFSENSRTTENQKLITLPELRQLEKEAVIKIQRFVRKLKPRRRMSLLKLTDLPPTSAKHEALEEEDSYERVFRRSKNSELSHSSKKTKDKPEPILFLEEGEGRRPATLTDYLALRTTEILFERRMQHSNYSWELRITDYHIENYSITIHLELIGTSLRVNETLVKSTKLHFSPDWESNEIAYVPFDFSTIWPIVERVITGWEELQGLQRQDTDEEQLNSEDSLESDTEALDEYAMENVKSLIEQYLERMTIKRGFAGPVLCRPEVSSFSLNRLTDKIDFSSYLDRKGGVYKMLFSIVGYQHEERYLDRLRELQYITRVEKELTENLIESGVARVSGNYCYLLITVSNRLSELDSKTEFNSFAVFEATGLGEAWTRKLCVSWEDMRRPFATSHVRFYVPFILITKKLTGEIRDFLYENIENLLYFEESMLKYNSDFSLEVSQNMRIDTQLELTNIVDGIKVATNVINVTVEEDNDDYIRESSSLIRGDFELQFKRIIIFGSKDYHHFTITVRPDNTI